MPKNEIEVPHALQMPELRERLTGAIARLEKEYDARCSWEGETRLVVERKALRAVVTIHDLKLVVELELGFVLSPLSGLIGDGIQRQLKQLVE